MGHKGLIEAWFDGSHKLALNESIMGIGAVIKIEGHNIYTVSETIRGVGSSNCAEYLALIKVLEYVRDHHIHEPILIRGDSKLVINQMKGIWKCNSGLYYPLAMEAKEIAKPFKNIIYKWTARYNNKEADFLSRGLKIKENE